MTQADTAQRTREPLAANIRKATPADRQRLTATMARAFDDDPIANWFAAQDRRRARRVYDFMDAAFQITRAHGEVYTTDDLEGGAYWSPPGKWKMGVLQQARLLPAMVRTASWRRLPAVARGMNAIEQKHPHEPHYYLLALGVEPDLQGRSLGTQLMAPILERCDRERVPAYLESSKEKNLPLYERNGFRVTEKFQVPNGGPAIWLMWRDPR
ncbi:MAG: GNAT family N-acetyltransferase [Dehalococcoidia bacterium]|jgi:ribosomal protein S18 acetylase RimI-like enzyme|nr:GNAT family N-acetyltransferase [Dehalococcoidia bacterium]